MKIAECKDNISGIYKINFPNGKIYIGKSIDIKRRIKEHNHDKNQPVLYASIQKYFNGYIENFDILEEIEDIELLDAKEKYYIALYNSNNKEFGYNLTPGGDGAAYGIDNIASKFTEKDILEIISLLQNTEIPIYKIAESFNCSRVTIIRLNSGATYYNKNLSYPIRKKKYKTKSGSLNGNSKITEENYWQIVSELKANNLSFNEIKDKYKISYTVLTNLNAGKTYYHNSINYPIRKKNAFLNKK